MKRLVILGAGGHGRELLDIVEAVNQQEDRFEFLGFLDDTGGDAEIVGRRNGTVLGPIDTLIDLKPVTYSIGMGSSQSRRHFDHLATSWGVEPVTLIHPQATIASDVSLAPGCVVAAGTRVTTNVRLGRHTHLNVNCSVSHDCRLGDYVTLSPGSHLSGWTILEDSVTLGTGAVTKDRVKIGEGSLVGAGGVVVRDIPPFVTAKGVPARAAHPKEGGKTRPSMDDR